MQISASITLSRLEKGDKGDKGDTGEPGVPGKTYKPVRIRLWSNIATNGMIYAGYGDNDPWTDIVFTVSSSGKQTYYKCVQTFAKAQGTQPDNPMYSAYLVSAADYTVIATEVLLANNAVINLLQGNRVTVCDSSGSVTTGLQGSSGVQIWAGSATPDSAPYRVYYDGSFTATNANITGHITASTIDLKKSTVTSGVPNGALCFDVSEITLPALSAGSVRLLRILNPKITKMDGENLTIKFATSNIVFSENLSFLDATPAQHTLLKCGSNGGVYIELLGYTVGSTTVWLTKEIQKIS